ncbi:MAG: hypothetical protein OEZ68_00615 [Gammaproteobacteria bacterium]|nr:hypothetical protein [Gammaproteobacteria bacterium]MDH5799280.1 hypothetical protein [Gammaproteobacteria bacterium]
MKKTSWLFILLVSISGTVNAGTNCFFGGSQNVPLCQYYGKISDVYINSANNILLYMTESVTEAELTEVGFSVPIGNRKAIILPVTENPDLAKMVYATALTALAANKTVMIQMYTVTSGYLKFDRIWLKNQ